MIRLVNRLSPKEILSLIFIFAVAITARLFLIYETPFSNSTIDLNIYRDGGQLIMNGINPYDFKDNTALRNKLRTDSVAYISWTSETQERWDFYASSNLPLSLLFYGFVESVSSGNPQIYRLVFSFIDSILAMVIAFILMKYWKLTISVPNLLLMIGLGALSPTFLLWGGSFPEEKGLQILFMLLAVIFAENRSLIPSALFLGCSVAFKGLGVFIAPLCLFLIINNENPATFKINKQQRKSGLLYIFLTIVFTIIWFIPYMPEVFEMMKNRLNSNMGESILPEHGSVWTIVNNHFPAMWSQIKLGTTILITLLWGYTFLVKKLNIPAISIFILVLFVDVLLLKGSMDRMNIGIIVSVVLFGFVDTLYAKILGWFTIIYGFYLYPLINIRYGSIVESIDAKYTFGFLVIFCVYPLFFYIREFVKYRHEIKYHHSGT